MLGQNFKGLQPKHILVSTEHSVNIDQNVHGMTYFSVANGF